MLPRVTIIIPNWNGEKFLELCLDSLREQTFRDFETVLVDNGSSDDSIGLVTRKFPEVRVIPMKGNRGFSAAVNTGIRTSKTELVALLNNDTQQDAGWLATLTQAADAYTAAGFFASRLMDFYARDTLDGAGDALRKSGLPYRVGHGEKNRGQYDEPGYVFGACAAAALYRRSMLAEIGLFDEDFGSYCEDGDLSFRAQLAGYRCLYVPEAVIYHIGSASTGGKRSPTATRLGTRNSLSLLVKNLPTSAIPGTVPFFLFGQLARLLTVSVTGTLRAHLKGISGAWHQLPLMLEKRREIQGTRKISDVEVRRLLRDSSRAATASIVRRLRDQVLQRLGL